MPGALHPSAPINASDFEVESFNWLWIDGVEPPNVLASLVWICRSSDSNWISDDERLSELKDKLSGSEYRSKLVSSSRNLATERRWNYIRVLCDVQLCGRHTFSPVIQWVDPASQFCTCNRLCFPWASSAQLHRRIRPVCDALVGTRNHVPKRYRLLKNPIENLINRMKCDGLSAAARIAIQPRAVSQVNCAKHNFNENKMRINLFVARPTDPSHAFRFD